MVINGSDPNHFKFTGKERDVESLLDYFDARHYSSGFGRFMTPDWAATATAVPYANFGNPQSLNLYSYVQNNPTTMGDPDGHGADSPLEQDPQGSIPQSTQGTGWLTEVGKSLANSGISGLNFLSRMAMHGEWAPQLPEFNVNSKSANVVGTVLSLAIPVGGEEAALGRAGEGIAETEIVQRAMSKAELKATQETGLVRGGREGTHYVSDAVNNDAGRAQQRLALPQKPEVKATMEVPKGSFSQPEKVKPANNMPGGGTERTGTGKIPVKVKKAKKI